MPKLTEDDKKAIIEARVGKAFPDGAPPPVLIEALAEQGLKLSLTTPTTKPQAGGATEE